MIELEFNNIISAPDNTHIRLGSYTPSDNNNNFTITGEDAGNYYRADFHELGDNISNKRSIFKLNYGLEYCKDEEEDYRKFPKSDKELNIINFLIQDYDYNTNNKILKITLEENNQGFLSLIDKNIKLITDTDGLHKIILGNTAVTTFDEETEITGQDYQLDNKEVISNEDDNKMVRIAEQSDVIDYFFNNSQPILTDTPVIPNNNDDIVRTVSQRESDVTNHSPQPTLTDTPVIPNNNNDDIVKTVSQRELELLGVIIDNPHLAEMYNAG